MWRNLVCAEGERAAASVMGGRERKRYGIRDSEIEKRKGERKREEKQ